VNDAESVKVIRLSGELEIGRKDEIRATLCEPSDGTPVLLDLSDVTYADSIALTELLRFCAEARRESRPVALVIQTPQFARLIQYAGLATVFKVFPQPAEALVYLTEGSRQ
jgi:anti-anti-sigma factor